MNQEALTFDRDPRKMARSEDPESSKAAAAKVEETSAGAIRNVIKSFVDLHPGLTSSEIDEALGYAPRGVGHRRLPELRDDKRVYSVSLGSGEMKWYPAAYPTASHPPGARILFGRLHDVDAKPRAIRAALDYLTNRPVSLTREEIVRLLRKAL